MKVSANPVAIPAKAPAMSPRADLGLSANAAKAKAADILHATGSESTKTLEQIRDIARSFAKARQDARDAQKTRAHEDVIRLGEEFKLIRKVYADNPQEMARQLARIVKALKAALKSYAAATKGDPGAPAVSALQDAGSAVASADKASSTRKDVEGSKEGDAADAATRAQMQAAAKEAAQAYLKQTADEDRPMRARRAEEAQGTLAFLDEVRGFVKDILKTYAEAKIKAAFLGQGRDERSEFFKEADKALKELDEAMTDLQRDAKADLSLPTATASVTA